jgi:uncharacterized lipoprotein YajG
MTIHKSYGSFFDILELRKGEVMKIKTSVSNMLIVLSMAVLSGCASKVVEVHIPPHTPMGTESQLSLIESQKIHLESVKDLRAMMEGKRESLGISMGDVVFVPPAVSVIEDVVVTEFENAGHQFSDEDQTLTLTVKIHNFGANTNSTPAYWDINGSIHIELEISREEGKRKSFSYRSACSDRTYVWPSGELFKAVMLKCIDDFADKLRNDKALAEAIHET